MKLKTYFLSIFTLIIAVSTTMADSPLTSTNFSKAYSNEPIIIKASKTNGKLTTELMDYLTKKKNPIDVKMALINKLGWNIKNKNNADIFMEYLKNKYGYSNQARFLKKGRRHDILAMAYIKALDNYFKVDEAIKIAERALKKNRKSRTANLIVALIKAQKAMDGNWCEVYKITNQVRDNKKLRNDIKPAAVKIIYGYMDIYKDSCSK